MTPEVDLSLQPLHRKAKAKETIGVKQQAVARQLRIQQKIAEGVLPIVGGYR